MAGLAARHRADQRHHSAGCAQCASSKFVGIASPAQPVGGEPVRREKLIRADGSGFMAAVLPAGKRAVAINIDTRGASSAGGFVLPNDFVDIIRTYRDEEASKAQGIDIFPSETILSGIARDGHRPEHPREEGREGRDGRDRHSRARCASRRNSSRWAQKVGQLSLVLRSLADAGQKMASNRTTSKRIIGRSLRRAETGSRCNPGKRMSPSANSNALLGDLSRAGQALATRHLLPPLALPLLSAAGGRSAAGPPFREFDGRQPAFRRLEMSIGTSHIVDLHRDAKEVFVGNPGIANAVVSSARKIFLIGVANGATSVFVTDADGQQIAAFDIVVGRDLSVLRKMLRDAIPSGQLDVKPAGDCGIAHRHVDTPLQAKQAVDIANAFVGQSSTGGASNSGSGVSISLGSSSTTAGQVINAISVRGKDQVMLKVTVAEVQRTIIKQLGINTNGNCEIGKYALAAATSNPFSVAGGALSDTLLSATGNFARRRRPRTSACRRSSAPAWCASWPSRPSRPSRARRRRFWSAAEIPAADGLELHAERRHHDCALGDHAASLRRRAYLHADRDGRGPHQRARRDGSVGDRQLDLAAGAKASPSRASASASPRPSSSFPPAARLRQPA